MYKPRERRLLVALLLLYDGLLVTASLWLAYFLRLQSGIIGYTASYDPAAYTVLVLASIPIWLFIFAGFRLYDTSILLGGPIEYVQVLKGCSFGALALVVVSFFWREETLTFSRLWLVLAYGFSIVLIGSGRFLFRRLAYWLRRRYGLFIIRVLIVGTNEQGKALARQWSRSGGYEVLGFLDDFLPPGTPVTAGLSVLAPPRFVAQVAHERAIDEVVVVPTAVAWETFEEIVRQSAQRNGFSVKMTPGFYETLASGIAVVNRGFVPLFAVQQMRVTGMDAFLKRFLDWVGGALIFVFCVPVMLLVAAGLKVTMPRRPVLFRPRVYGLGGKFFTTYRFDVKVEEGDQSAGARLRRFLYTVGLDKLPQLVNVLLGQMSLVGPRTISEAEVYQYRRWLPNLLTVKPGVTGVWAVERGCLEDEIRATMYYIRNWTIWLDLQVLFRTVLRSLRKRRGAFLPVEGVGLDGLPHLDERDVRVQIDRDGGGLSKGE